MTNIMIFQLISLDFGILEFPFRKFCFINNRCSLLSSGILSNSLARLENFDPEPIIPVLVAIGGFFVGDEDARSISESESKLINFLECLVLFCSISLTLW